MTDRRYLNIQYENQPTEIDLKDMNRFSDVQKEVLVAFPQIAAGYPGVQLWNKNNTNTMFDDLDVIRKLPEQYYKKPTEPGAVFLTVQLLPTPTTSSQTALRSPPGIGL
jgi:hypothetical protein